MPKAFVDNAGAVPAHSMLQFYQAVLVCMLVGNDWWGETCEPGCCCIPSSGYTPLDTSGSV